MGHQQLQHTTRGKENKYSTSAGIEHTTSRFDRPSLHRLSYEDKTKLKLYSITILSWFLLQEWSTPLEDDDADDNETDGKQKEDNSMLEEGYDADQEGDSDRSDETEQRPAKNKKQPKQRRRNEDSKSQQITKGLVIYPQICNIILQLLKVCYGTKLQTSDSERYAVLV